MALLMTHRRGPPEEHASAAGRGHTKRGMHSGREYTTGVLRLVRARERAMVLMVHDVTSNDSTARAWSGEVRAGQTTQRPWRRNSTKQGRGGKSYAPNVTFIPAPSAPVLRRSVLYGALPALAGSDSPHKANRGAPDAVLLVNIAYFG